MLEERLELLGGVNGRNPPELLDTRFDMELRPVSLAEPMLDRLLFGAAKERFVFCPPIFAARVPELFISRAPNDPALGFCIDPFPRDAFEKEDRPPAGMAPT